MADVERLRSDLKASEAKSTRYLEHIKGLEQRHTEMEDIISALESYVARLEAEGLKPLVDRLRTQITAMRKLLSAMAEAIEELTG